MTKTNQVTCNNYIVGFCTKKPGRRYGPVWHTCTFLAAWKPYRHFFFREKSSRYALQAILCNLSNWSLMFASISGQNSGSLSEEKKRRHIKHTGTYFFHFEPCKKLCIRSEHRLLQYTNRFII